MKIVRHVRLMDKTRVVIFRPATGEWFLDFGSLGDRAVVGDWTGNGIVKLGAFRPATGEWFLDLKRQRQMG